MKLEMAELWPSLLKAFIGPPKNTHICGTYYETDRHSHIYQLVINVAGWTPIEALSTHMILPVFYKHACAMDHCSVCCTKGKRHGRELLKKTQLKKRVMWARGHILERAFYSQVGTAVVNFLVTLHICINWCDFEFLMVLLALACQLNTYMRMVIQNLVELVVWYGDW